MTFPSIPFFDFSVQHNAIREELKHAALEVIESDWFILGNQLKKFEAEFATSFQAKAAIGVSSGLEALRLAMQALDIDTNTKVIVPAHTFIASALAVSALGAQLVLEDVNPNSGLLDIDNLKCVKGKNVAIMPVHLYGNCCEMEKIQNWARNNNAKIIEDASQAHGSKYKGKFAGTLGDVGAFSLYPTKNIGALGDSGIVTTNELSIAEKIRTLRNYGSTEKYVHLEKGVNSRMDEIQAAILSVKLSHINSQFEKRKKLFQYYRNNIDSIGDIRLVQITDGTDIVPHLFVIRTKLRNRLQEWLTKHGVESQIHYPTPVHLQPAYKDLGYVKGSFPEAEAFSNTCLSLPFFPDLELEKVDFIIHQIKSFFDRV